MPTRRPRGAWLTALAVAAALTAAGALRLPLTLRHWQEASPFQAALAVMVIPGAFLAALPGRIRSRTPQRSTRRGCLMCFLAGVGMTLVYGLSGYEDGLLLTGLTQGSASAWAFTLAALPAAIVAARLRERRRSV